MARVSTMHLLALGLLFWAATGGMVQADCGTNYDQAITLFTTVQGKVTRNEHPDPNAFETEFQGLVTQLEKEKCAAELKKLTEYIFEEQKKYPATPQDDKNAPPIED